MQKNAVGLDGVGNDKDCMQRRFQRKILSISRSMELKVENWDLEDTGSLGRSGR